MPPAFDSPRQAAAFTLLLLFLLAAPWLGAEKWLSLSPPTYSSESVRWEHFPWLTKFVFEETNDIDIAFMGSSHMLGGIDTRGVQQELDRQEGRTTVVRSLSFYNPGFDCLYGVAKDLLAHRHVKVLVFDDECPAAATAEFHKIAPGWFRFENDGTLAGLPLRNQAIYYYAAVLGVPRQIMAVLAPNLPADPNLWRTGAWTANHAADPETRLGSLTVEANLDSSTPFAAYAPTTSATPADARIFSPATASSFAFSRRPLPANQIYFARQLELLAQSHGVELVQLHIPVFYLAEGRSPVMTESRNWLAVMSAKGFLLGIPNQQLFAGLSDQEISRLYFDSGHLNANGQRYFTSLITPALLRIYADHYRN